MCGGIDEAISKKGGEIRCWQEYRACDTHIISALSKLEASNFYRSTIIPALMFDGSFFGFSSFRESV